MTAIYHVNPSTRKSGVCRAAKKPCPFGAEAKHFQSKDEASAWVERFELRMAKTQATFGRNVSKIFSSLKPGPYGYRMPGAVEPFPKIVDPGRWLVRYVGFVLEKAQGLKLSEEELAPHLRDAMGEASDFTLTSPIFWEELYERVYQKATTPAKGTTPVPGGDYALYGRGEPVGSLATAGAFAEVISRYSARDVRSRLESEEDAVEDFRKAGFTLMGWGEEQVAFYHRGSNTVWKTPKCTIPGENSMAGVRDQVIGADSFPELGTIRHARTSGYQVGGFPMVAQEHVQAVPARALTSREQLVLNLAGHDDVVKNYTVEGDGTLVAFDTLGSFWEDGPSYPLTISR